MSPHNIQASDTFVTHSRANFYFLLCAEPQDGNEFSAAPRRRPEPEPAPAPVPTPAPAPANGPAAAPDAGHTKLMKGIINMQIKEGRLALATERIECCNRNGICVQ